MRKSDDLIHTLTRHGVTCPFPFLVWLLFPIWSPHSIVPRWSCPPSRGPHVLYSAIQRTTEAWGSLLVLRRLDCVADSCTSLSDSSWKSCQVTLFSFSLVYLWLPYVPGGGQDHWFRCFLPWWALFTFPVFFCYEQSCNKHSRIYVLACQIFYPVRGFQGRIYRWKSKCVFNFSRCCHIVSSSSPNQ